MCIKCSISNTYVHHVVTKIYVRSAYALQTPFALNEPAGNSERPSTPLDSLNICATASVVRASARVRRSLSEMETRQSYALCMWCARAARGPARVILCRFHPSHPRSASVARHFRRHRHSFAIPAS